MIGTPSDLSDERLAATAAVNDWNAQHTDAEGVVLLPVKWETHATPTSGVRPQSTINDQFVDRCDILVGMFWTKLGTATGAAASGTVEEIDRFVAAGKPAMLYFSQRKAAKDKVDPKQLAKLQKFKAATYKKSLVGSFASVAELTQHEPDRFCWSHNVRLRERAEAVLCRPRWHGPVLKLKCPGGGCLSPPETAR